MESQPHLQFPNQKFDHSSDYFKEYVHHLQKAANSMDPKTLHQATELIQKAIENRRSIFVAGNGGSAAIANHLHCDFLKGISTQTPLLPKVVSLASTVPTITAISNDLSYDEVFAYQLERLMEKEDLLIVISSSGNSKNILRALEVAKSKGKQNTIAFTGFSGGEASQLAQVSIHYPIHNYGIVEDLHQMTMHVIAQFLRSKFLNDPNLVEKTVF